PYAGFEPPYHRVSGDCLKVVACHSNGGYGKGYFCGGYRSWADGVEP
uniref:Uncharacterized protein n=1 Tax=Ciona intestinalis TaxID=7719 RepID=H2Y0B2_CIOIN